MFATITAIAIILLTAATIGLFAMVGELASRVDSLTAHQDDSPSGGAVHDWADPLEDFVPGNNPEWYPGELISVEDSPCALLVILSTSCQSCSRFAEQNFSELDGLPCHLGFIISCPTVERGQKFVRNYPTLASRSSVYIDAMGEWTRDQLGLDVSPSAVVLQAGRPAAAFTMSSPNQLAAVVDQHLATDRETA
ncbi:hypothetical protein H0B56_12975 [Haloechinothrix sp. YIM 98757]|uniref:Thioredoxin domain-containing protein n=1 Tax=Haloechinothrix aidingensis TaxID=2752311 RepID=A0A838AB61_9PSEU|nr:hypothetical protein [Haloechinothrix aidingensis]MBA0126456.1 hypothetical protein [Haloechinothrix aidingensis]